MQRRDAGTIDLGVDARFRYHGELFTGVIVEYHADGTIMSELEVKNGLYDGFLTEYYPTGQLLGRDEYKIGYRIGCVEYDLKGNVKERWSIYEIDEPWAIRTRKWIETDLNNST